MGVKKRPPVSQQTRTKQSKAQKGKRTGKTPFNKGKIFVNKEDANELILPEELDSYLEQGYNKGQIQKHYKTHKGKIVVNNGIKVLFIFPKDLDLYLKQGYNRGYLS